MGELEGLDAVIEAIFNRIIRYFLKNVAGFDYFWWELIDLEGRGELGDHIRSQIKEALSEETSGYVTTGGDHIRGWTE